MIKVPPHFSYAVTDHVATITIDRAENRNAFTRGMAIDLTSLIDRCDMDDEVRAIILTGAGTTFSVGADLSGGAGIFNPDGDEEYRDAGGFITLRLFDCNKPTIVAFNGSAGGMGVTISLAADYRIAVSTAKFAVPFVRRGIAPESCSSWFLPRLVSLPQALDWMLSGRTFDAEEARTSGLIRSIHAQDELLDAANMIAREIVERAAPISVALTRRMLWQMSAAPHPMDAHLLESRVLATRFGSLDVKEGAQSFLDKRVPNFPGRISSDLADVGLGARRLG